MTLFSGGFSLSRYRVLGLAKNIKLTEAGHKFQKFQAKPIKIRGNRELSYAWEKPILGEKEDFVGDHWDLSSCEYEGGFLLRIRIEKRKVPTSLLQLMFKENLAKEEEKREGKPLGRNARKELLEETRLELLDKCLPQIGYCDVYWDLPSEEVLLYSTSKAMQSIFEDLFRKSFCEHLDLNLVKIAPPLLGLSEEEWQINLSSPLFEKMGRAIPSELAGASESEES